MLDRTRSHKFVNGDTNASSVVVVVVICVLKVFTTIRGIFVIRLELKKNLLETLGFLKKKKIRASNKSLTIFSHSFIQSAINGVVFFPHSTSSNKNNNPRKLRTAPRTTHR